MRHLVVAVVLAGCGPETYVDFRDQAVERWCAREHRCGRIGRGDDECTTPTVIVQLTTPGALDVPDGIADGKLVYDKNAAANCLDAIDGAPCDESVAAAYLFERCHAVIGPARAVGKKCHLDEECVGGTCVGAANGCPGTCTAYPPPGWPCEPTNSPCDPTVHWCGAAKPGEPNLCQRKKLEGSKCAASIECVFPFVCVEEKCARAQLPVEDAKNQWSDLGLACVSACGGEGACALCPATQECVGGVCALKPPPPPVGPHRLCIEKSCQAGLYCSAQKRCEFQHGLFGECDPNDDGCAPGLVCATPALRCLQPGALCSTEDGE